MSGFVIFTDAEDGEAVLINAAHIVAVAPNETTKAGVETCCVFLDSAVWCDEGGDDVLFVNVNGTLLETLAVLNAATPQLHPSILMPPPAPWAPKPQEETNGGNS